MDTTLVICTDGASYRNFVNASVIGHVAKRSKIVIVCASWMVSDLQKRIPQATLYPVYQPSTWEAAVDHIRMTRTIYPAAIYPEIKSSTLKIKQDRALQETPLSFYTRRVLAVLTRPRFVQSLMRGIAWQWKKQPVRDVFRHHVFSRVFSTNVMTLDHLPYVESAMRKKIPVVSVIGSWDNLSSKGTPMYLPDLLLLWSPKEVEESTSMHRIPPHILRVVGAAQFDPYILGGVPSKAEVFRKLKIPTKSVVITYVGGIPQNVAGLTEENERIILETVLKGIDEGILPKSTIVVIRPHPGVKDWVQYRRFEQHPQVRMNYPSWFVQGKEAPKSWNPDWEDHLFMGALMKYSDVAITPGGSSTLDAACFDTPTVNVYFDNPPRPYLQSLRSHCDFQHLAYIRDYMASPFAESPQELLMCVKDALDHPKKLSRQRQRMLDMLIGPHDGQSAKRIADAVMSLGDSQRIMHPQP